ncbi:hypothetical protein BTZ20_2833 [Rhodococcus sp. MTM3W5.2]|nr:hypothetical protein BTZ20_2833 [Rhodococcus sp. MTM3W5.2]
MPVDVGFYRVRGCAETIAVSADTGGDIAHKPEEDFGIGGFVGSRCRSPKGRDHE